MQHFSKSSNYTVIYIHVHGIVFIDLNVMHVTGAACFYAPACVLQILSIFPLVTLSRDVCDEYVFILSWSIHCIHFSKVNKLAIENSLEIAEA